MVLLRFPRLLLFPLESDGLTAVLVSVAVDAQEKACDAGDWVPINGSDAISEVVPTPPPPAELTLAVIELIGECKTMGFDTDTIGESGIA